MDIRERNSKMHHCPALVSNITGTILSYHSVTEQIRAFIISYLMNFLLSFCGI